MIRMFMNRAFGKSGDGEGFWAGYESLTVLIHVGFRVLGRGDVCRAGSGLRPVCE